MPDPATPLPPSDYGLASTAVQMALALLLILAIILVAYWLLRRFGPKLGLGPAGRGGMLRLMAHLSLGPRKSVIVVRFLNRDLVLGVCDQSITLLTEVPTSHETDSDFAEALDTAARTSGQGPAP